LKNADGVLASVPPLAVGGAGNPGLASHAAAFRATDYTVLVLGQRAGQPTPAAELWRVDIAGSTFELPIRLAGDAAISAVHAVAIRAQDPHLYALVELEGIANASLVRIPLDGTTGEVLQAVGPAGNPQFPSHALLFDALGDVVLIGYGPSGFTAVLAPFADLANPDARLSRPDVLLLPPVSDPSGVSYLASDPQLGTVAGGFDLAQMATGGQYSLGDAF
jgi:hypothetical protein